jgi:hypothetical protein
LLSVQIGEIVTFIQPLALGYHPSRRSRSSFSTGFFPLRRQQFFPVTTLASLFRILVR